MIIKDDTEHMEEFVGEYLHITKGGVVNKKAKLRGMHTPFLNMYLKHDIPRKIEDIYVLLAADIDNQNIMQVYTRWCRHVPNVFKNLPEMIAKASSKAIRIINKVNTEAEQDGKEKKGRVHVRYRP